MLGAITAAACHLVLGPRDPELVCGRRHAADPVVLDQPGELGAPLRPAGLRRVGGRGEQRRGLEVANSGFVEVRRARALLIAVAARLERAEVEALALRLVDLLRGRAFRRGLLGEGGNREGESHCDGVSDPFHSFTISPPLSALR
jgi:hypothetical protein